MRFTINTRCVLQCPRNPLLTRIPPDNHAEASRIVPQYTGLQRQLDERREHPHIESVQTESAGPYIGANCKVILTLQIPQCTSPLVPLPISISTPTTHTYLHTLSHTRLHTVICNLYKIARRSLKMKKISFFTHAPTDQVLT